MDPAALLLLWLDAYRLSRRLRCERDGEGLTHYDRALLAWLGELHQTKEA